MKLVCLSGVFLGALIMLLSIVKYYRALVFLRAQSYSSKTFSRWTYLLCMCLMLFFLVGYLALGTVYLSPRVFTQTDLLISTIFFFGAVFVFTVITVQGQMSQAISRKTNEIILGLVNAMEAKDQYTRGHSVHVAKLCELFYRHLPPQLQAQVNQPLLKDAAILHDIGKIGISDAILNKPAALTREEMDAIQQHPRLGKQILQNTSFSQLGEVILAHHERMDQKGYYGMHPDDVPLESRMIAIADTFSALYSDRVYRPRKTYEQAMDILGKAAGSQLDPALVEVFLAIPREEIDAVTGDLFAAQLAQQPGMAG